MSVSLIEIQEATVTEVTVAAFSPADILEQRGEKMEDYRRDLDGELDLVVGIRVTHCGNNTVVVTLFNHDGEAVHYIGPQDHFVMDPPFDEEPAYDNYSE